MHCMRIIYHILFACCAILAFPAALSGQEVITPLFGKPAGEKAGAQMSGLERTGELKSTDSAPLELPFMDDFSEYTGLPDTSRWSDARVFINRNYAIEPVSVGVATLDVLDGDGSIYPDAEIDPGTFVADHLTSRSLKLDHPASDSIYLSFLYQPEGLGDRPEVQDSLMVDFFDPLAEEWVNVWRVPGDTLHPFRHAMIPVTGERFLKEGFRFRFRNLGSLSRNQDYPDKRASVDHWNVDYVKLDRNRSFSDTVLRDVAVTAPISSILKDLTALPWDHFEAAHNTVMDESVTLRYRNNDTITRNVTRTLVIRDLLFNETHTSGVPTAQDIPPGTDTSVLFGNFYPFDFERGDSAIFRIQASIRTDEFDHKVNDTVIHDQLFSDYYAYDDGTAEAGYGLRGQGTRNGTVAMRYQSFEPDLLGGVDICFNQLYDSVNLDYYFKLMVWSESGGIPGQLVWEDENDHTPVYSDRLNGFTRYRFSEPVPVSGKFFVGWMQYNEFMLNVGLDLNSRPSAAVMYYNFSGTWQQSLAPGVIMFRPFLHREITDAGHFTRPVNSMMIYPNPASDMIRLGLPEVVTGNEIRLEIYDMTGRMVDGGVTRSGDWNVSELAEGIYIMKAVRGGTEYTARLLINR